MGQFASVTVVDVLFVPMSPAMSISNTSRNWTTKERSARVTHSVGGWTRTWPLAVRVERLVLAAVIPVVP